MIMCRGMLIEECIVEFASSVREYIVSENSTMHDMWGIPLCKEIIRFSV